MRPAPPSSIRMDSGVNEPSAPVVWVRLLLALAPHPHRNGGHPPANTRPCKFPSNVWTSKHFQGIHSPTDSYDELLFYCTAPPNTCSTHSSYELQILHMKRSVTKNITAFNKTLNSMCVFAINKCCTFIHKEACWPNTVHQTIPAAATVSCFADSQYIDLSIFMNVSKRT